MSKLWQAKRGTFFEIQCRTPFQCRK